VRYLGSWPTGPAAPVGAPPDDAARWLERLREGKPAQPDTSGGAGR
jgi:prephenate dehydratase